MKRLVMSLTTGAIAAVSLSYATAVLADDASVSTTAAPQKGVMTSPCSVPVPPAQMLQLDFGQMCHYEGANATLPAATDHRVIYFGDSITEFWTNRIPGLQADDVLNRGVSGQTTAQMLVRFRADVLNLHPRVVHFLVGTNDIAGNTGATSISRIEDAIMSMAEQAKTAGIRVVLASILPVKTYPWSLGVTDPVATIHTINTWMQAYAAREGFIYADYFSTLNDGQGGFKAAWTYDGVHPNADGYMVMNPIALDAVKRAAK